VVDIVDSDSLVLGEDDVEFEVGVEVVDDVTAGLVVEGTTDGLVELGAVVGVVPEVVDGLGATPVDDV
jgi:hypothetical protein